MFFVRSIFYWASKGYPDAVPAGIIATDLGDTADLSSDIKEIALNLTSQGIHDDSCWQCQIATEDRDLLVKTVPHEKYGEIGHYLTSDQLLPDWEYQLIKQQPGLVVSEHHYLEMEFDDSEECECCDN